MSALPARGPSVAAYLRGGARRAPERVAVEWDGGAVTYAALDRRTDALARGFQDALPGGGRVGVYCSNRVEWIESYVAAHKAGIAVVPINHRYRSREVGHVLADADVRLVVCDDSGREDDEVQRLLAAVPTLAVGDDYERVATSGAAPADREPAAEDAIIYTSGTTALPRGVVYTRDTQVTSVLIPQFAMGYDPSDRFLFFTPLAHRAAQPLLLCALFMGATMRLLERYSAAALVDAVERGGVSALTGVPTALRDLLGLQRTAAIAPMGGVRHVLMSGETMTASLLDEVMALFPNARLGSAYGSTEAGLVTFLDHEHQRSHPGSCGRALQGVEVRLVDDDGADGERGEVLVRGGAPGSYTVAAGYLGRDGSVESFVDADGWFATGDIATVGPEGFYAIVDRKKDMILSGGMNVASREVETVIASHPDVVEVAVTGEPDERFGERVVAWVVAREGAVLDADAIVAHVVRHTASYKKPSRVRFIDALPRTVTGKVLKRTLGQTHEPTPEISEPAAP